MVSQEKPKLEINWTTMIKTGSVFRVEGRDPRYTDLLLNPSNIGSRDGDLNFHGGLISLRADMLTELDLSYGNYGVRASAAGWDDPIYNRRVAANPTSNSFALGTDGTHFSNNGQFRDQHFQNIEYLDAFFHGKQRMGNGSLSFRAGRFAQTWGETLFFGGNGIAGGMVPLDAVKGASVPNSTTKEIMRPVPQVAIDLERPKFTFSAYYQFLWEPYLLSGAGSYFSASSDYLMPGGRRMILPYFSAPGVPNTTAAWYRGEDVDGRNGGQFGVQLLFPNVYKGTDIGFYAIRYNEKVPGFAGCTNVPGQPACVPRVASDALLPGFSGTYYSVYSSNVRAYAMSLSKNLGRTNWAMEVGGKTNLDLTATGPTALGQNDLYNNTNHIGYPIGKAVYANVSALSQIRPFRWMKEGSLSAELGWNALVSVDANRSIINPRAQKHALGFQATYGWAYRRILPTVDLKPKIGFSYTPIGKSSVSQFGPERGGNVSLGGQFIYKFNWNATVTYNHYYGPTYPNSIYKWGTSYGQTMNDRDFVAISIFRSFGKNYHSGKGN